MNATLRPVQRCTKTYRDIPFAHRQPAHPGHCALIHGHNWDFTFVTEGVPDADLDFVLDFGGPTMKAIKREIDELFDHACVLNRSDAEGQQMVAAFPKMFKLLLVESCSAEGLARFLLEKFGSKIDCDTRGTVRLVKVIVHEDTKNTAEAGDFSTP